MPVAAKEGTTGGSMKTKSFAYRRAGSAEEACAALAAAGADTRVIAGGQSLVPMMNFRVAAPALLVDINACDELAGIVVTGERVRIGALTRHRETERSPAIATHLPLIAAAIPHVAHPAVRNRGTFGGSLAHADPAAELPACALLLGATMVLRSVRGERSVPVDDFFLGLYETALEPDEILVAIEMPARRPDEVFAFREVARRHGDFALAGIAGRGRVEAGRLVAPAFVAFGVADRPVRLPTVASAVAAGGALATADLKAALAADVRIDADGHHGGALRAHLAAELVARTTADLHAATREAG